LTSVGEAIHVVMSSLRPGFAFGIATSLLLGTIGSASAQLLFREAAVPVKDPQAAQAPAKAPRAARAGGTAKAAAEAALKTKPEEIPKGPLEIVISIADQRVSVYGSAGLVARSGVSTGMRGHPTPLGVFTVIQKQRWHRSNIYSAAPMPFMQRITWSGVALHAGVLPGYPASHGCIRLSTEFAMRLWRLTRLNTRVIVARNDVAPVDIVNPHLFAPRPRPIDPPAAPQPSVDRTPAAIPEIRTADAGKTEIAATQILDGTAQLRPAAAPPSGPSKIQPISVFVSRKQGKLWVRQGFTPLLDTNVTIRNPDLPLGTYVFTAVEAKDDGAAMRWTVVALPAESARKDEEPRKEPKKRARGEDLKPQIGGPAESLARANAALDRIDIPQDARDRISGWISLGSSLVVSDYGLSDETDADTDLIVLTR